MSCAHHFLQSEFSCHSWRWKVVLRHTRLKLLGCIRTLKSSWDRRYDLSLALPKGWVLTSLITENIGRASYKTQTCRMYKRHKSHRKTGGIRCLRHLLKSYVLTSLMTEKTRLGSYRAKTCRMSCRYRNRRKTGVSAVTGNFRKVELYGES